MSEKKSNKVALIAGIIIILLLLGAVISYFILSKKSTQVPMTPVEITKTVEEVKEQPIIKDTSITLAFCGDSIVHTPQVLDAYEAEKKSYDFRPSFQFIKDDIKEADYAITNLETVFAEGEPSGYPRFNTPDEFATALKDAGFDMVTTANNHALDQKMDGLMRTIDILDKKELEHIGTYKTKEDYEKTNGTLIKNIKGYKIGFMALSKGSNGFSVPKDNPYALNVYTKDYTDNKAQKNVDYDHIKNEIDYLKNQKVDVIVALMHWGLENYREPAPQQEKIAKFLTENGVQIVMGNHPNVQQRYVYDQNNNSFVVYSLGNFVSSMTKTYTQDSGIMYTKLDKDNNGKVYIKEIYYKPITTIIRERGLSPRFVVMDTQKTLENIATKKNKDLLSMMTADIAKRLYGSLQNSHTIWGDFVDYYEKYKEVHYDYSTFDSEETQQIFEGNEQANVTKKNKINWVK